jgi:hypothetical protein
MGSRQGGRCNQLLSWVQDPKLYKRDNPNSSDPNQPGWKPERPTLIGTGNVVEFEP